VQTLRSLGMPTEAYRNTREWLILAWRDPAVAQLGPEELAALMRLDPNDPQTTEYVPHRHEVRADPHFVPITDERPYLAGNVRYILSMRQVYVLFALAGGLMAATGGCVWLALRRRGDPQILGRPYAATGALAVLIGANFLLVEHALVLALFRRLFVYDDALALGVVAFLGLSSLGSLAGPLAAKRWLLLLSAVGFGVLLLGSHRLPVAGVLVAAAPVALTTGTFFPALFDRAAANPLAVFALDAIGAGLGAVLATFVPIVWGFGTFFAVTAVLFGLTAAVDTWFYCGLAASPPEAEARSGRSIPVY
jgi:hypothetical protein